MRVVSEGKGRWVVMVVMGWRRRCDEAGRGQGHGGRVMMMIAISRVMVNGIGEKSAGRHGQRIRLLTSDAGLEDGGGVAAADATTTTRTGSDGRSSGGSQIAHRRRGTRQRDVGIVRIDERFGAGTERTRPVGVVHQQIDVVV